MRQPQVQSKSVETIVFESRNWNLNPGFQRDSVFSKKQKSALIETILDSFPIGGSIFLVPVEDDRYNFAILDGKQRILTLKEFMQDEFPFEPEDVEKYSVLRGKLFRDFPKEMKRRITCFELPIVILDAKIATRENVKLMFKRINTTGVPLNGAEIRSSMETTIGKAIKLIIDSYNRNCPDSFSKHILVPAKESRMKDEDAVAALYARYYYTIQNERMDLKGKEYPDLLYKEDFSDEEVEAIKKQLIKVFKELTNNLTKPFKSLAQLDGIFSVLMHHKISWHKVKEQRDAFQTCIKNIQEDIRNSQNIILIAGGQSHGSKAVYERYRIARAQLSLFLIETDKKRYYTLKERELLWENNPHVCSICGKPIEFFEEMDVDHIIPHNRGGKTILANAQVTCSHCNRSKQDKV